MLINNKNLKVVFISHSSEMGGSERSLLELLADLPEKGIKSHVILPENGPLEEELKKLSIDYTIFPYRWWVIGPDEEIEAVIEQIATQSLNLADLIRKINPDLIYSNTSVINIGAIVARELTLPHIWHVREYGDEDYGFPAFILDESDRVKYIDNNSSFVIFNSISVKKHYSQFSGFKSSDVVYNNVSIQGRENGDDIKLFDDTKRRFRMVMVGSINKGKGQKDAVLAINELKKDGFDAELVIIGLPSDERYYAELISIIKEHDLTENVHMAGYLENSIPVMSESDVVIVCSKLEAFGRVSVEGMLVKKPIIGAESGGTIELIEDGVNGLLYEVGNIMQLKEKIKFLIENRDVSAKMGIAGYNFVMNNFSKDKYSTKIKNIIKIFAENNSEDVFIEAMNSLKIRDNIKKQKQEQEQEINRLKQVIEKNNHEINLMASSKFWKIRNKYMKIKGLSLAYFIDLIKKAIFILKRDGIIVFIKYIYKYLIHGRDYFKSKIAPSLQNYYLWIEKNEKFDVHEICNEIEEFKYKPKISIITPVYNVDQVWLDKCIQSVLNQSYENWELCLHDDASTKKETIDCLKKWENIGDVRIKISHGKENQHISGASNSALELATGEFIALLDNDDELSEHALFENVKILNNFTDVNFIYSDEDKIEEDGTRLDAYFKPDWSLAMFLSMNYTCHFSVYRKSIIDSINGFRKGYEGSQDYDLALRVVDKINEKTIFHIPKILYHWRKIDGSTAQRTDSKNYAYVAAKKALHDFMTRNNIEGIVEDGLFLGSYRIRRKLIKSPLVSIIVPTKDKIKYLKPCILSILDKTNYSNFEIIILDTGSVEPETKDFYNEIKHEKRIRIIEYIRPEFNFAEANTWVTQYAEGEYLLFLNNDTEVMNNEWLGSMMEFAQLENVGIVGAKLLFPNNTIQHMGIVVGLRNGASHAGVLFPEWQLMSFPFLHAKDVARDVSAVTGACLLISSKLFKEVGGFDKIFRIAFNDTDLCLKVRNLGYNIIYTPYAKLIHYESITFGRPYEDPTRSTGLFETEQAMFNKKWKENGFEDPFYNRNLTLKDEGLSLRIQ